ncbi:MAG: hypothetical protein A2064_04145 [Spirochaetes bacterium GWB1_66_5]|nr:MAG: hypothetical protein A2064_04145 [Spirochaetes bacterium GWB1_66_5]
MLEIRPARSGQLTARIGGAYLHSPYDPEAEARRFAESSLAGGCPAMVLLLGAELGHAGKALLRLCPGARLLPVYYDPELAARGQPGWGPASGESLLDFLRRALPEAEGLLVLEWPASARLYPQASLEAWRQTAQLLRELRGGLATTAAVGRRWLANCLNNFLGIDRVLCAASPASSLPILIAASGPSLPAALPALGRLRERFQLWALPSAVECLLAYGLVPDLAVLTDPGYYGLAHLFALRAADTPLAMPLSAAAGAWSLRTGVQLLAQEALYEQALLSAADYPAPIVPPQGTVAATAMELALRRTRGQVIFAGLDLCFQDLLGHARPNLFESTLESGSDRLQPLHHRRFTWAQAQAPRRLPPRARTGQALETYAGWFASRAPDPRLYRLLPSEVALPGFRPLDQVGLERLLPTDKQTAADALAEQPGYPDRPKRLRLLRGLLGDWQRRARLLASRIASAGDPGGLQADPLVASLAGHFDAARLAESRRDLRARGREAAASTVAALLLDLQRFLEVRRERGEDRR